MATTKKTKAKKTESEVKSAEVKKLVPADHFSMVISRDELFSMVQILGFSKDVFTQMAIDYKTTGNEKAAVVFTARAELSLMLWRKFRDVAAIGEPQPGEIH